MVTKSAKTNFRGCFVYDFIWLAIPLISITLFIDKFFRQFKGHSLGIEAMQLHMPSQPVKSLRKRNFTIIYWVHNWNSRHWINNVRAITMLFLSYNVCIDWSESVWYAVEQYGEKTDQNAGTHVGYGPTVVMHS